MSVPGAREFAGRTAVVTGGGSGLGAATARLLAQRGASVWIADRDLEAARAVADQIPAAAAARLDVTVAAEWARLMAQVPRLDILINAAGIAAVAGPADVAEVGVGAWREVFAVNVEGVLLGCQAALRVMRAGAIVNVCSTAGVAPSPALAAYGASKAAAAQLTLSFAAHCATAGLPIRCNAVAPGMAATPMTAGMSAPYRQAWEAAIPLARFADPTEIAEAIAFLASDRASYICGEILRVDGGLLSRPIVTTPRGGQDGDPGAVGRPLAGGE